MRQRRSVTVRGTVQGVGFRPFVHSLASKFQLGGFVQNCRGAVHIEIEGDGVRLDAFVDQLVKDPPPLARIHGLHCEPRSPRGDTEFQIVTSQTEGDGSVIVSADATTCPACLAELFDPADRRFRYPFLNCTNCGPRLTIITGAPYDRRNTTMAGFPMCPACRAEYLDPTNRRFHAQPIACPECGPKLTALDAAGRPIADCDDLAVFIAAIQAGQVGAMKGLGGYHLVCNARDETAVSELRRRKHREEKPLAVMVPGVDVVRATCEISDAEEKILTSCRRPIVLLRKSSDYNLAGGVAPGNPHIGVMLPYTPLHHLLLHDVGDMVLVMTSGNRSDEPIAYEDGDAVRRLSGIADVFLTHNRPIHLRCDDSVTRVIAGWESPVRRSRGYAPAPLPLPMKCPVPILAVGGQLKATFAIGQENQAIVSHHAGDLDNFEAYRAYERDVKLYEALFSVRPAVIAHDLHPDYASSRYAAQRVTADGLELIGVQHHHAHLASCMAEHGLTGEVIGVTFDGSGYGLDGCVWGGEFLTGGYDRFHRAARLRYVPMPGGEQAVREPWRMALSHLLDAQHDIGLLEKRVPAHALRTVNRMIERRFNSPLTSSAGRLFDAVAALANVRDNVSYEGQAAIQLEWLAANLNATGLYPFHVVDAPTGSAGRELEIDTRPLISAVADEAQKGYSRGSIARRFHATMAEIIVEVCLRLQGICNLNRVVLSGGVFMNDILTTETNGKLAAKGFKVYCHQIVPPGDGGLSLGQIAVAATRLAQGPTS